MNVRELVDYCRTHRVVRVATLYVPLAWAVLRVSLIAQPGLGVPDWIPKILAIVLIIGYPIALIISWAMDIADKEKEDEKNEAAGLLLPSGYKSAHGEMKKSTFGAYLLIGTIFMSIGLYAIFRLDVDEVINPDNLPEGSVAVLPFVSLSSDPENQIFCDGLSEELLNLLAGVDKLSVAARTSSYALSNQSLDIPTIGNQLRVKHVVEGSVRKVGERIRVTAQLVRTEDGYHVWSQNYDREFADIFAVQDDIAANIVTALVSEIDLKSGSSAIPTSARVDPDAYYSYLLGRGKLWKPGLRNLLEATAHFTEALQISPDYSPARAAHVFALSVLGAQQSPGSRPLLELLSEATQLHQQDMTEPLGAASVAILSLQSYQWSAAQNALELALARNPNNAVLLTLYANLFLSVGDIDAAKFELGRIRELKALSPASEYLQRLVDYEGSSGSLRQLYISSSNTFNWTSARNHTVPDETERTREFSACEISVSEGVEQPAWRDACDALRDFVVPVLSRSGAVQIAVDELLRLATNRQFDAKLLRLPELRSLRDQKNYSVVETELNLPASDEAAIR